jgi:hypothetical protein
MAALTGSSTDEAVWAQYDDNAAYDVDSSVTKAKLFIEACRVLLRRRPTSIGFGQRSTEFEAVQQALDDARKWLALNNTSANGGSVRHLDFRNLRD